MFKDNCTVHFMKKIFCDFFNNYGKNFSLFIFVSLMSGVAIYNRLLYDNFIFNKIEEAFASVFMEQLALSTAIASFLWGIFVCGFFYVVSTFFLIIRKIFQCPLTRKKLHFSKWVYDLLVIRILRNSVFLMSIVVVVLLPVALYLKLTLNGEYGDCKFHEVLYFIVVLNVFQLVILIFLSLIEKFSLPYWRNRILWLLIIGVFMMLVSAILALDYFKIGLSSQFIDFNEEVFKDCEKIKCDK